MWVRASLVMLAAALAGCANLLPRGQFATQETWGDYESAKGAIDKIIPFESRRIDLAAAGLDPTANAAVTVLHFSDVVQRFAGSSVKQEELDAGIRRCLTAGKACTGYWIAVRRVTRQRIGNFWLDTFNFYREIDITGWSFNALILFVDDLVVYTLHGGQPKMHDKEVTRTPLGPLQGWGERIAPRLLD